MSTPSTLPEGIQVTEYGDTAWITIEGPHLMAPVHGLAQPEAESLVRHIAAAVAEQCAKECDRLANNYGSEKRDFAETIRTLFPKP